MDSTLQYIWHDCFVLRLPDCTCVFDFWEDAQGNLAFLEAISQDKPLYVIVSHHHKDHFNRGIFRWAARFPKIRFIISKDTARSINYMLKPGSTYRGEYKVDPSKVTVLRPGEEFADGVISLRAFGSTDIGNSYLLTHRGQTIFHSGDLNAWIWKDESTDAEIRAAIGAFRKVLADIRMVTEKIDLAMFPVDSRIGRDYWEGAYIFLREFDVKLFVPMHFCLGKDLSERLRYINDAIDFSTYANPERGRYAALTEPYSTLAVDFS